MISTYAGTSGVLPNMTGYPGELDAALQMLLCTEELFMAPALTKDVIWAADPISREDFIGARPCAKTGMMVPVHAQEHFQGKVYSPGRAPLSKPSDFR